MLAALAVVAAGLYLDLKPRDLLWAAALFGAVVSLLGAASLRLLLLFWVLGLLGVSLTDFVRSARRRSAA